MLNGETDIDGYIWTATCSFSLYCSMTPEADEETELFDRDVEPSTGMDPATAVRDRV